MKRNKNELDVDFIGGQEPLTKEEELSISEFIQSKKPKGKVQKTKSNLPIAERKKEAV